MVLRGVSEFHGVEESGVCMFGNSQSAYFGTAGFFEKFDGIPSYTNFSTDGCSSPPPGITTPKDYTQ